MREPRGFFLDISLQREQRTTIKMTEEAKKVKDKEEKEEDVDNETRLSWDGYSAEIVGCNHIPRTDYEAIVELERDTRYRIKLSNANDHMCMVKVELDGVFIGE